MNEFVKGDKVFLKDPERHLDPHWGLELTVDEPTMFEPRVGVEVIDEYGYHHTGAFFPFELVKVASPELPAQFHAPKDIRIVIGDSIGSVVYKTEAEALEAAEKHGKNGEDFALVEVKHLGDYTIHTTALRASSCF